MSDTFERKVKLKHKFILAASLAVILSVSAFATTAFAATTNSQSAVESTTGNTKKCGQNKKEKVAEPENAIGKDKAKAAALKEVGVSEDKVEKIKARIVDGLQQIPGVEYDKNRLEQELIYYIEKLDISEEKQRLTNHLKYFRDTMNEAAGQGKKLGFIAQEMGREINTTGSKSNQAEMQNIVVKMKDELEQIKEQVLNAL